MKKERKRQAQQRKKLKRDKEDGFEDNIADQIIRQKAEESAQVELQSKKDADLFVVDSKPIKYTNKKEMWRNKPLTIERLLNTNLASKTSNNKRKHSEEDKLAEKIITKRQKNLKQRTKIKKEEEENAISTPTTNKKTREMGERERDYVESSIIIKVG